MCLNNSNFSSSKVVNEYYDSFQKQRGMILEKVPVLPEEFFISSFVGGLVGEIKNGQAVGTKNPGASLQAS